MAEINSSPAPPKLKKIKKANFSTDEENLIQEEVEKYYSILHGKITNKVTNQKKKEIWDGITSKVNALGVCYRTTEEIRNKWRNTTREAKSVYTKNRQDMTKTGGGPSSVPAPSQAISRVISLLQDKPSFCGIEGGIETTIGPSTQSAESSGSDAELYQSASNSPATTPPCSPVAPRRDPLLSQTIQVQSGASTSRFSGKSGSSASLISSKQPIAQSTPKKQQHQASSKDVMTLQCKVLKGELEKQALEKEKLGLQIKLLQRMLDQPTVSIASPTSSQLAAWQLLSGLN